MILGVCGYGYTGSGALFDLLKEFSGVKTLVGNKDDMEFTLTYAPDGLEDLEYNLAMNPSKGTRCDIAIYRFMQFSNMMQRGCNSFTAGQFKKITNEYLDSLIQVKWDAFRVFEYERDPQKYYERIIRQKLQLFLRKHRIDRQCFPTRERYLSIFPENFIQKTRAYISALLSFSQPYDCLLLNQPFSANNPQNSMRFFENPKCIFVDRDPRDLYVMVKYVYGTFARFIPTDSVEHFIEYYLRTRDRKLYIGESDCILHINFEDLVYEYDASICRLNEFIGEDIGIHVNKGTYFQPDVSKKNTYVYRNYPQEAESIKQIETALPEWLYPFEDKKVELFTGNLNSFTFM